VRLAEGMGCLARRVDDPGELAAALSVALAAPEPTVPHLPVAPDVTPPYWRRLWSLRVTVRRSPQTPHRGHMAEIRR
jgi:thiamine pyrophosphate-dependent acetolactate synthase large subunit-like protein